MSVQLLLSLLLCVFQERSKAKAELTDEFYENLELSCHGATRIPPLQNGHCPFVTWTSARMYDRRNFTSTSPGMAYDIQYQHSYSNHLYQKLVNDMSRSKSFRYTSKCGLFTRIFSCSKAFPHCPFVGTGADLVKYRIKSTSYLPPCRKQCEILAATCFEEMDSRLLASCAKYPTANCFTHMTDNYFFLDPMKGPYDILSSFYLSLLVLWLFLTTIWYTQTFSRHSHCAIPVCRLGTMIPVVKTLTLLFACIFWQTCERWLVCTSWINLFMVNLQVILEAVVLFLYLLLARGWSMTRAHLDLREWRYILGIVALFYVGCSVLMLLQRSTVGYTSTLAVFYGLFFLYASWEAKDQVDELATHVKIVHHSGLSANPLLEPMVQRYNMYCCFLVLTLLMFLSEMLVHSAFAQHDQYSVIVVSHELLNTVILMVTGWIFRPRQFSPFFFLVPTVRGGTGSSRDRRPHRVIEVEDIAETDNFIIDLESMNHNQSKHEQIIVIKTPYDIKFGVVGIGMQ